MSWTTTSRCSSDVRRMTRTSRTCIASATCSRSDDRLGVVLTVMRNDWRGWVGAVKSGKDRKIPLTSRATRALKAVRHLKGKLVFCWEDGSRWTNSTLRAGLKRQQKRAGLRITGWHVLRHSFCSHLAMRGAPAVAMKELAGHASIAVTNRYMHLSPGELRNCDRPSRSWATAHKINLSTCNVWVSDGD